MSLFCEEPVVEFKEISKMLQKSYNKFNNISERILESPEYFKKYMIKRQELSVIILRKNDNTQKLATSVNAFSDENIVKYEQ